jgi:hypothetical protein
MKIDNLMRKISSFCFKAMRNINQNIGIRPMIEFIKTKYHNQQLICAEIGVAYGNNAFNILSVLNIKKMFLIDPYEITPDFPDGEQLDWIEHKSPDEIYNICRRKLQPFNDKIVFIRKPSNQAVKDINVDLDFLYVDGNHKYEYVKSDLNLYYPLVKPNGIIGGDDFSGSFIGVCKAVLEFVDENDLKLYGKNKDWWFIKKSE